LSHLLNTSVKQSKAPLTSRSLDVSIPTQLSFLEVTSGDD